MTRETKVNILDAFDALQDVTRGGRSPEGTPRCDVCAHPAASRGRHPEVYPIGAALAALGRIVPSPADRGAWLRST